MSNLLFILSLGICLGFEFNKLYKFNSVYRINVISSNYGKHTMKRLNSNLISAWSKFALLDVFYSILTIIGIFTINSNLFCVIIIMSFVKYVLFKYIKIEFFRKSISFFDIMLSITLLTIILANLLFYKIPDTLFLTNLYNSML